MVIKNNFSILKEFDRPFITSKDYIIYDIMSYTPVGVMNTYVHLKSERKLLSLSEYLDFIEEKKLLKWRSDDIRESMISYYENILTSLRKYSREEKIDKLTNKELYNIDNLCLAC